MEGVPAAGNTFIDLVSEEGRPDSAPVVAYSQPRSPARACARAREEPEVQSGERKRKTVGGAVPGVGRGEAMGGAPGGAEPETLRVHLVGAPAGKAILASVAGALNALGGGGVGIEAAVGAEQGGPDQQGEGGSIFFVWHRHCSCKQVIRSAVAAT
jgi:hypothetical protein